MHETIHQVAVDHITIRLLFYSPISRYCGSFFKAKTCKYSIGWKEDEKSCVLLNNNGAYVYKAVVSCSQRWQQNEESEIIVWK